MPTIEKLEENLNKVTSVTGLLEQGSTPEDILKLLLAGMEPVILEKKDISFECDCSSAKIEKALISVGASDLQEMIDDGEDIEMKCSFCGRSYKVSVDKLKQLLCEAGQESR